jgi:hypothetical protein
MSDLKFNKEFLDLVNRLTTINTQIIFEKENDKVLVSRFNPAKSIAYQLRVPKESFDFAEDKIAMYNYPGFYQLFSVCKTPVINQTENTLIIADGKSKINYLLSNLENIQVGPKKNTFADPTVSFDFTEEEMKNIRKMISLIQADYVKFIIKDNNLTVKLFNNSHDNSYEKEIELKTKATENFEMIINSEVFTIIPENPYTIDIKKEGVIRISYVKDNIDLKIYTAEIIG